MELDKEMAERKRFNAPIEALLRRRVTGGFIVAVLLTVFVVADLLQNIFDRLVLKPPEERPAGTAVAPPV